MDYLQYCFPILVDDQGREISFKPCYKWITFNTLMCGHQMRKVKSFKPCYKWITFNTDGEVTLGDMNEEVLNLVINGLPSIHAYGK